MPTTTPLTDAIQALTTYANETTGASDTTLSAAVGTLVAGYGGGGSVEHFMEPNASFGTMTVDENNALPVKTALTAISRNTLVIAFCSTATNYKILLLWKRANGNVSVATGFSGDYGNASFNQSTWSNSNLTIGDTYYLFTGTNF